jgi:hypothetical protein
MNLLLRLSIDPGRVHPLSPVPPGLYAILAKGWSGYPFTCPHPLSLHCLAGCRIRTYAHPGSVHYDNFDYVFMGDVYEERLHFLIVCMT